MPENPVPGRPAWELCARKFIAGALGLAKNRFVQTALVVLALVLLFYMTAVAPYEVELTMHRLAMPLSTPIRVMQISDLHSSGIGDRERAVLNFARSTRPDLILVTGDSVTSGVSCRRAGETLDQLDAPLGVWVVPGNWEYWMAEEQGAHCLCPTGRGRCLRNESVQLREDLWLVGIDDLMVGRASVGEAFVGVPPQGVAVLVMAHEPTIMDRVSRESLILSGHTHGGQICLPLIGPVLLPPESGDYEAGWYRLGNRTMYVSRGVGMSVIPARLLCTPEVSVFDLMPLSTVRR